MISLSAAAALVMYMVVAGLVFWLLLWLVDYCGIPEPFNKVVRIILAVLAVAVIIGALMSITTGRQLFVP